MGHFISIYSGVQWLSGRVLDLRPRGGGFEPHRRHFVVSLSKNINPSIVLVQPRKTCPFITERLLIGRKESNQTKQISIYTVILNYNTWVKVFRIISEFSNFKLAFYGKPASNC